MITACKFSPISFLPHYLKEQAAEGQSLKVQGRAVARADLRKANGRGGAWKG